MISVDNVPIPLLGLTYVNYCSCHECVLEWDPCNIGIAVSYCFILNFCAPDGKFVFFCVFIIECFLHPPDKTQ